MSDDEQQQEVEVGVNIVQLTANVKQRSKEVDSLLASSNFAGALLKSLEDPPYDAKDDATPKNIAAETVARVLSQIKEAEIAKYVNDLTEDQRDVLMKFVYRGLANNNNPGHLFKVHAAIVEKSGIGSVVRAIAERKSVV